MKTIILIACALRASAFAPSPEPESGTWLFSATGLFTGSQTGSRFVMQETKNVIAFTDRPRREAFSTTLATVAGIFDSEDDHVPPNAVLTLTAQSCTQDENVFSIPVTLESHTFFENEPDKMAFTYTLLRNVTAQESEALSACQACQLAIFVDSVGSFGLLAGPQDPVTKCIRTPSCESNLMCPGVYLGIHGMTCCPKSAYVPDCPFSSCVPSTNCPSP